MKYLISISLLLIYLTSSFQSTWEVTDFYMHREEYTQKYCEFLDQGITQCRASCYLEKILSRDNNNKEAHLSLLQKVKDREQISELSVESTEPDTEVSGYFFGYSNHYHFDISQFVFRPPKSMG